MISCRLFNKVLGFSTLTGFFSSGHRDLIESPLKVAQEAEVPPATDVSVRRDKGKIRFGNAFVELTLDTQRK